MEMHLPDYSEEEEKSDDKNKGNPAVFLAEVQEENNSSAVVKSNLGPLDHHQQTLFQILTGDAAPVAQPPYRMNPVKREFLKNEIVKMEAQGIIRKSSSPWASPVVIVEKKEGDKRLCIDYQKLNAITKADAYPLPRIDDLLKNLRSATWFTTLDLASGYWQVQMSKEDIEKPAFITPLAYFLYLDDVIIYTRGPLETHLDHLHQVFEILRSANLQIKLKKCYFCYPNIYFLGHVVGRDGIQVDPEKIEKVKNFPIPQNLRQLRAALGLFSYYRKFIKDFSKIVRPMNELLKKNVLFEWDQKKQNAFERLKECLMKVPILSYPDFNRSFIIYMDASGTSLGTVLSQLQEDGKEHVIAYASRSMNKAEMNYAITDQECFAVVWAVQHFQHYLGMRPFTIVTDHIALKWLKTSKILKGRRARWIMELQQYNFQIKHRPGKANANADALSQIYEHPVECYMISIIPSGLNNEEMPEEALSIGKCHGYQQERPFLEKYSIQGKSFLCCQSYNINLKDNEEICERCHKSVLCTDE
ncbi:hypothetical protein RclHR1_23990004 [Rhizophagus clarus]|uniref:Reverse transcriptase domain-containing protein n=1 Tax=Rhizophagus clarus TaxID=94130 RepID=A0A2Z6QX82_9GLOM|nr:hypothetical protein RclHR1_23990004 [Rhizophagus clarus]